MKQKWNKMDSDMYFCETQQKIMFIYFEYFHLWKGNDSVKLQSFFDWIV